MNALRLKWMKETYADQILQGAENPLLRGMERHIVELIEALDTRPTSPQVGRPVMQTYTNLTDWQEVARIEKSNRIDAMNYASTKEAEVVALRAQLKREGGDFAEELARLHAKINALEAKLKAAEQGTDAEALKAWEAIETNGPLWHYSSNNGPDCPALRDKGKCNCGKDDFDTAVAFLKSTPMPSGDPETCECGQSDCPTLPPAGDGVREALEIIAGFKDPEGFGDMDSTKMCFEMRRLAREALKSHTLTGSEEKA